MTASKNSPLSFLSALATVMLLGTVFLMASHAYFHQLRQHLSDTAINQQARIIIVQQIVIDLHQIKAHYYQLLPMGSQAQRMNIQQQIDNEFTQIRSGLNVIEHGGVFQPTIGKKLIETEEVVDSVQYAPTDNGDNNIDLAKLIPILTDLQNKTDELEILLQGRDTFQRKNELQKMNLVRQEIIMLVQNTEPLFIQLTDDCYRLFHMSNKRLAAIQHQSSSLTDKYRIFEIAAILAILTTTFSLCFLLARKILTTNRQLHQEIQDRKQAESSIKRAKQEWERTVDAVTDPMAMLDCNHRIVRLNKAMADLVGKPVDHCVGLHCYEIMHKSDTPPEYCPHSLLLSDQQEHKTEQYLALFNADMEICVSPLFDDSGQLVGSVHIARDITDKKRAEELLRKANEELEQKVLERTAELQTFINELQLEIKNRIKAEEALVQAQHQLLHSEKLSAVGKLSASIAHEFNNPLFAITNILIGVREQESLSEPNTKMLKLAIQECDRLTYLIKSLQDFNRPTTGVPVATDIHHIIDTTLLLCKKEFKDRQLTVAKEYDPQLPMIMAVTDQIRQVLLNLFTNARDACESGGLISVYTKSQGNSITISVEDSGCGIDINDIGNIFKPFFSTKHEFSGTGLGLAVCHGIIENHGGKISVDSSSGKGSIFTVTLPVKTAITHEVTANPAPPHQATALKS